MSLVTFLSCWRCLLSTGDTWVIQDGCLGYPSLEDIPSSQKSSLGVMSPDPSSNRVSSTQEHGRNKVTPAL